MTWMLNVGGQIVAVTDQSVGGVLEAGPVSITDGDFGGALR